MNLNQNKSTEKDLRDHLQRNGYFGRTARFKSIQLRAIERPGWVQVFQFEVEAKSIGGDWERLFGHCRTDERCDLFEVQMGRDQSEIKNAFAATSEGLITHKTTQEQSPFRGLLFVVTVATVLVVAVWLSQKL